MARVGLGSAQVGPGSCSVGYTRVVFMFLSWLFFVTALLRYRLRAMWITYLDTIQWFLVCSRNGVISATLF